jgi:hypothetical protein
VATFGQQLASALMAFGRRKHDSSKSRDPFEHLADERRAAESDEPWFLGHDDGPELDVEAGISSNLHDEDLE